MTITYNIIITINAMFMGLDDGITMDNPLANYQADHPSNPQQPIHSLRKTRQ